MGRRVGLVLAVLGVAALLGAGSATAKPRFAGLIDLNSQPQDIARGPDGSMWVVTNGLADDPIVRIDPDKTRIEYDPAAFTGKTPASIASGPDGNLWVTVQDGVIRVPPDDPNAAQHFAINKIVGGQGIVQGPGGLMWTPSNDQLVSFDPANPAGFDAETIDGMGARGITASGGRLFIADFGGQRIVRADPDNLADPKFFNVGGGPQETARGPEKGIAYSNPGGDPETVGRIKKTGGAKVTDTPQADPFGVVFAEDHRFWFAEFAKDRMLIMKPDGSTRLLRGLPDGSGPRDVAKGPAGSGTVWVTLDMSNQVARIKGVQR